MYKQKPMIFKPKSNAEELRGSRPINRLQLGVDSSHRLSSTSYLQRTIDNLGSLDKNLMLQRKITMTEPNYVARENGLAEDLRDNGLKNELGFTEPLVNGKSIFENAAALKLPEITIEDSRNGNEYEPQYDEVVELEWGEPTGDFVPDERDEEGAKQWNIDRYLTYVTNEAENIFGWDVTFPPSSGWKVSGMSKKDLFSLIATINAGWEPPENFDFPDKGDLIVFCPYGNDTLIAHTIAHEKQHVGDHIGLISAIVGPWDKYAKDHNSQAKGIVSDDKFSGSGEISRAGGFTPGPKRVLEELKFQMIQSGDTYHRSIAGRVPMIVVSKIKADRGEVYVEVLPHELAKGGDIPEPQYVWPDNRIQG